jgi:hypothetical protein
MLKVRSNLNPSIFTSPVTGKRYLVGGTVHAVNGVQVHGLARVADWVTLDDIEWVRPESRANAQTSRLDPNAVTHRTVQSQRPGVTYEVTLDSTGRPFHCTCPGYTYRRFCKHLQES